MLITDFFGSVRETVLFEDNQPETVLLEEILPETTSFEGSSDNNTHNIKSAVLRDSIQLQLVSQLPF